MRSNSAPEFLKGFLSKLEGGAIAIAAAAAPSPQFPWHQIAVLPPSSEHPAGRRRGTNGTDGRTAAAARASE